MQCPNGHAVKEAAAKFCLECGAELVEPPKAPAGEGVHIGEKAQVLGDAIGGDKTEIKTHGGAAHIHHHTDQTKEVRECSVCGQEGLRIDFHKCPSCNEPACEKCYLVEKRRCGNCETQAQEKYQERLKEAYSDGNVGRVERSELNRLADELRISKDQARELEAPLRNRDGAGASKLSRMDKIAFNKARQFLEEFKTKEVLEEMGSLYADHGHTNEAVRKVYLLALIEENPEELLAETQRILDDEEVDDAMAYLCVFEVLMRQEDLRRAEKENQKAQARFRDDIRFKAQEAELMLESHRQNSEDDYLSAAGEILDALGEGVKGDPYAYSVYASYMYDVEGGKVGHFWEAEETLRKAGLSTWFVVRKIGELELKLETKAETEAGAKAEVHRFKQHNAILTRSLAARLSLFLRTTNQVDSPALRKVSSASQKCPTFPPSTSYMYEA
jgi:hypothetical protein